MIPVMDLIPSLRTYEVIEPSEIRGLVFDDPDSTRVHPKEMTVALQAFGVKYELQLERVDDLFGAEYGHYSWDVDAARVVPPANHDDDDDDDARRSIRRDHCHYRGVVRSAVPVGADVGDASLDRRSFHEAFAPTHTRVRASLCDGITARIVADDVVIHLEPAHRHVAGYPMRSDDPKTSPVVAYRDADVRDDAPRGMTRYAPRPRMTTVELDGGFLATLDRGEYFTTAPLLENAMGVDPLSSESLDRQTEFFAELTRALTGSPSSADED